MMMQVTLGQPWMKKIIVFSHPRSGTHFLMNTIADNFGYTSTRWIDLDYPRPYNWYLPANVAEFFQDFKGHPVANIFKSHHPFEFIQDAFEEMVKEFLVFYIYRDIKDVMESYCRLLNAFPFNEGPKCRSGKQLAMTEPCGALLRYQQRQYQNMQERYWDHLDGWMGKDEVIYVRFEDLRDDFENTVRAIGKSIRRSCPDRIVKPYKDDRTITPELVAKFHGVAVNG